MNYTENLGERCELLHRGRSPYPPRAWLETPRYPIRSDPDFCRLLDEENEHRRQVESRQLNDFHDRVCDRLRRMRIKGNETFENANMRKRRSWPRFSSSSSARYVSYTRPNDEFLDRVSQPGQSTRPALSAPRLPRSRPLSVEAKREARIKQVRSVSALRDREQARQWRTETARREQVNELKRQEQRIDDIRAEAFEEERRNAFLNSIEQNAVERESRLYATEMKRLIANRILRNSDIPPGEVLTTPYGPELPFGQTVLSFDVRRVLRRLPPVCPCTSEWWETNPDICECSLRHNWTELSVGLEKLLQIAVHGCSCF